MCNWRPSVDIQNPVVFVLLDCLRYCSPKVEFIPDRTLLWFVIPLQSLSASHNKTPRLCELNSEPLTPSVLLICLSSALWWPSVKRWKSKQCLCHSSSKALRVVFVVIKDPQLKLKFWCRMALILHKFLTVCKCLGPRSKFLFIAAVKHWTEDEMIKKKRQKLTGHTFPYLYISRIFIKTEVRLKLRFVSFRKVWRRPAGLSFSRPPAPGGRRRRRIGKECVILLMMRGRKMNQWQREVRRKVVVWRPNLHSPLTSLSVILEEEIWRLQKDNENKEETIIELRVGEERRKILERELNTRQEEVIHLKKDLVLLEQKVQQLSGIK